MDNKHKHPIAFLTKEEANLVLQWFTFTEEFVRRGIMTKEDYVLAKKLYESKMQKVPDYILEKL